MMSSVAVMISGPIPSPYATVIGVFFAMNIVLPVSSSVKLVSYVTFQFSIGTLFIQAFFLTSTHNWECRGLRPLTGARGCPSLLLSSCGPKAHEQMYVDVYFSLYVCPKICYSCS